MAEGRFQMWRIDRTRSSGVPPGLAAALGRFDEESHWYRRSLLQRERPCRTPGLVQTAPGDRRSGMGRHRVHVDRCTGNPTNGTTVWSIGAADGEQFAPSKSTFMVC